MTTLISLEPDPSDVAVRHALGDAHRMHQVLMRLVPDQLGPSPRAATGLLWRQEIVDDRLRILVQLDGVPDLDRLPDPWRDRARTVPLDPVLDRLVVGGQVRVAVTANPSKRLARDLPGVGRRGQRVSVRPQDWEAWWLRTAERVGLRPVSTRCSDAGVRVGVRAGRRVTHRAVEIGGVAEVADAASVRDAVRSGIGRGRAHGLGMLCLVPLAGGSPSPG